MPFNLLGVCLMLSKAVFPADRILRVGEPPGQLAGRAGSVDVAGLGIAFRSIVAYPPPWDGAASTRSVPERRALVARGLRRARAVVSRIAPGTDVRASADPEHDARARPPRSKTPAKTTEYRLAYMNIKGLAEPARLALRLGGLPFTETRVSYDDLASARARHAASSCGRAAALGPWHAWASAPLER